MSEFGKGLCYNLGLFIAHERNLNIELGAGNQSITKALNSAWFYGSTDHLYDIQIEFAPKKLQKRLEAFVAKCFSFRTGVDPTVEDIVWAVNTAKQLLLEIDKANGVPTKKAMYL